LKNLWRIARTTADRAQRGAGDEALEFFGIDRPCPQSLSPARQFLKREGGFRSRDWSLALRMPFLSLTERLFMSFPLGSLAC
jgi:hypothetical protein